MSTREIWIELIGGLATMAIIAAMLLAGYVMLPN